MLISLLSKGILQLFFFFSKVLLFIRENNPILNLFRCEELEVLKSSPSCYELHIMMSDCSQLSACVLCLAVCFLF